MRQIPATRAGSELVSGRNEAFSFHQQLLRKEFHENFFLFHRNNLLCLVGYFPVLASMLSLYTSMLLFASLFEARAATTAGLYRGGTPSSGLPPL